MLSGVIIATISILSATAVAGAVGAGGLGSVAITYGYRVTMIRSCICGWCPDHSGPSDPERGRLGVRKMKSSEILRQSDQ